MKYSFLSFLLLILSFSSRPAFAEVAATDFDQDGHSDLTAVTIQSNGALKWSSVSPMTGVVSDRGVLGKVGDHLIPGTWLQGTQSEIGVVSLPDSENSIVWKIMDQSNSSQQRTFGLKDDLVISGADFDGNKTLDAAVARQVGKYVQWEIYYNPFSTSSTNPSLLQGRFGSDRSKVFYANPDGTYDWSGLITKTSRAQTIVRLRNLVSGKVRNYSRFPRFVSSTSSLVPLPVRGPSGADILAFVRKTGASTRVDFIQFNGKTLSKVIFPAHGDVVVGDFSSSPGEEVALKDSESTEYLVFNPFSKISSTIVGSKGIAVDAVNLNVMKKTGVTPAPVPTTPTSPSNPGGTPKFPEVGTVLTCSSIVDINSLPNLLYKNENLHGGRGRSWLDQGHRMGGARRVFVAGLNGVVFGCFGLYACDRPFGCRYYQQMCGDPQNNAQFSAAAAKNDGGSPPSALVSAGSGVCYKFRASVARDGNIIK